MSTLRAEANSLPGGARESGNQVGNILIVDDTPANLRLLTSILNDRGYKVRAVVNGAMALAAARAAPPDLILLDITMPEMDGYQVCQRLKDNEITRDIPVIFISALDATEDKVKALTIGGVDYITKPFQIEEVLARVQTHIALRTMQKRLEQINDELEQRVAERTTELRQLNAALERFVPREFLEFLHKSNIAEVNLGDQVQHEMTILISDIRDFTPRAEKLGPQESFKFLNAYMGHIVPVIRQRGGFIDKYMGDGVLGLFPCDADEAVQAAVDMQYALQDFNVELRQQGFEPLRCGASLHTGLMALGIIGEAQRWQSTVIADAVNLASRMETLNRLYDVSIVISAQTLAKLNTPSRFQVRFLDRVQVKGKQESVEVFEVLDGGEPDSVALKLQTKPDFEVGLYLYYDQKFAEASVQFTHVLQANPQDRAARLYLERAAKYMVQGAPSDGSV